MTQTANTSKIQLEDYGESVYRKILRRATNFFGAIRILTYVPTIGTLVASRNSDQYSVATWMLWILSNFTLAMSIYEYNGKKLNSLVLMNLGNTAMCLVTSLVIIYYRF